MVTETKASPAEALRFLKTGQRPERPTVGLAEACDNLIRQTTQKSVTRAISLAHKFVARARRDHSMPLHLALRALGWASHVGGKYRQAETAYLEARHLVLRQGDLRARIDRILIDVYMYRGQFDEARRRARLALDTFRKLGQAEEAAKTRINLANLYHRQDRHRDARSEYEQALVHFEQSNNVLVRALCQYNLANTEVQLVDFERARELYGQAEANFISKDYALYANECRYGLAWLAMLEGDFDQALRGLDACERHYREAGQPKGVLLCRLDRAEAYLGLNMFVDARALAADAEKRANKLGITYEAAKAAFFQAKAAFAGGNDRACRAALVRSRKGFHKDRNRAFLAAVDLFEAQTDPGPRTGRESLRRARAGFSRAQLPLWEAMCDLQLATTGHAEKSTFRRLAGNPAVAAVPHLYAHWQTLLGDVEIGRNRRPQAIAHWRNAASMLDQVRAKLPPVDLRSTFLQGRQDPYLQLIHTQCDSNPGEAAAWSERYKMAGIWAVRTDSPESERDQAAASLAKLADRVTALSTQLSGSSGTREALLDKKARLTNMYRDVQRELAGLTERQTDALDQNNVLTASMRATAQRLPILQFHDDRGDLLAFVHEPGGIRTVRFIDGTTRLEQLMGCWRILLNRSLQRRSNRTSTDLSDETELFGEIGDWLLPRLEIDSHHHGLLVIPDGRMTNLPWFALRCHGRPLAESTNIILTPSFRHFVLASQRHSRSPEIRIFMGRHDGLAHSRRELKHLSETAGTAVQVHDPCRRADWPRGRDAYIWHYVGHAETRRDNPFYSALLLEDGPLFAADFRTRNANVDIVTLAACRTGYQAVLPAEESTGLVRSLLEMGARHVIGSHWAVNDESTAQWMTHFYTLIFDGVPIAKAVRLTSLHIRERYPSAYDWAAFSVFGADQGGKR